MRNDNVPIYVRGIAVQNSIVLIKEYATVIDSSRQVIYVNKEKYWPQDAPLWYTICNRWRFGDLCMRCASSYD